MAELFLGYPLFRETTELAQLSTILSMLGVPSGVSAGRPERLRPDSPHQAHHRDARHGRGATDVLEASRVEVV